MHPEYVRGVLIQNGMSGTNDDVHAVLLAIKDVEGWISFPEFNAKVAKSLYMGQDDYRARNISGALHAFKPNESLQTVPSVPAPRATIEIGLLHLEATR